MQKIRKNIMLIFSMLTQSIGIIYIAYLIYTREHSIGIPIFLIILLLMFLFFISQKFSSNSWWVNLEKMSSNFVFIIVAIVVLLIPYGIHDYFFKNNVLEEKDLLMFYGSYITFLGTFGLGYVVFKRDKIVRQEDKINKIKLLYSCIYEVFKQMSCISENERLPTLIIEYDKNWKNYVLELSSLNIENSFWIRKKLEYIFTIVDRINVALENEDCEKANKIVCIYYKNDRYFPEKFNYFEVMEAIYRIAYTWKLIPETTPWDEKLKNKIIMKKYSKKYYYIIENWIRNYMIKNNLKFITTGEYLYDLVDWLMTNEEAKKLVDKSGTMRIISKIIYEASNKMNKKSKYLNWEDEIYSFKETH